MTLPMHSGTCRVVTEPRDVSLIACVEEDGSTLSPVLGVDKISLLKCAGLSCIEVVQLSGEETEDWKVTGTRRRAVTIFTLSAKVRESGQLPI